MAEWKDWEQFGGTTDASVTATSFKGDVYVFAKGVDDKAIYLRTRTSSGSQTVDSGWKRFPAGGTTDAAVAATVFKDRLYVFSKGIADKGIYLSASADGNNWSPWKAFPAGGTTDAAVAATVFNDRLYVFSKGIADKGIYLSASADGSNWSPWKAIGGTTDTSVAATTFEDGLTVFARGVSDRKVYMKASGTGTDWNGAWEEVGGKTKVAPSVLGAGWVIELFVARPEDGAILSRVAFIGPH